MEAGRSRGCAAAVVLGGALAAFPGLLAAGLRLGDWLPRALLLLGVAS